MKKHGILAALAGVAMVGTLFAADRTTPLPVVSAFTDTGKKDLEFAENATIKVRKGARGGKVIAWTEETKPSTYDTLKFVRDPSDTRGYSVRKLDDGVYVVTGMTLVIR